jgi:V/A-type H+-transporting ATPase subunit A
LEVIGKVSRVVGPVVHAREVTRAQMLELVEVGEQRLIGEIVRLSGDEISIQVYEDTTGLAPGENIYGSGLPLSVELGPGLIGSIYDGVQRPLELIKKQCGEFIPKGVKVPALPRDRQWKFTPSVKAGDAVTGGQILGTVPETDRLEHRVLVPPDVSGKILKIAPAGEYTIEQEIATVETPTGPKPLRLAQSWPVRQSRPNRQRLPFDAPLLTGQRVIDTLFPIAKGGTVAVPGGFGTGKTVVEHQVAKWSDADVVVYIGCGERGNEMTDVLKEFPHLIDPRSNRPLMERTILIANTSNMPVAAREASIYTGVTLAEYYRDQGYHVAIMADSTSRWAEALRELSGRKEEMPAEEGFPAYLPTRLAEFYERAGLVETLCGKTGSISIVGAVSPPGGDFSEPVTQHTKRFIRAFWALDQDLANSRHYPAISWLDSYSDYVEDVSGWWKENGDPEWPAFRTEIMDLLRREERLQQTVKLMGPEVLPDGQKLVLDVAKLFKNTFLQQSAYDAIDQYSTAKKQVKMLRMIVTYNRLASEAIHKGVTIQTLRALPVLEEIARMKYTVSNEDVAKLDALQGRMEKAMEDTAKGAQ